MKKFFILPAIIIICFLSVNIFDNCCAPESSHLDSISSSSSKAHIENHNLAENSSDHKDCLPNSCAAQCHCGHLPLITFNKDYDYKSTLHDFNISNQKIDLKRLATDLFRPPIA